MPQFDFYIFNSLTIISAALTASIIFVIMFHIALTRWLEAQVRLFVKAFMAAETRRLVHAMRCGIFFAADLLEQFIMPGPLSLLLAALIFVLTAALFFSCAAVFARAAALFVGSIGADIYSGAGEKFSRSWINFSAMFFCVLMFNLVGILPFSFTATGSLAAPFCFSLTMFFLCFITATMRGGLAAVAGFLPTGTERTIAPLVILIEVVSNFAKFVSLGVRLFANMFAGHLLLKVFYSICFQVAASINFFLVLPEVMTGAFVFFVVALEVMIAFLQAFVFILLSILYLKEAENFLAAH